MEDPRIQDGMDIIQLMWYNTAIQIVTTAVRVYNLNKEQEKALRETFLRPNDYSIRLRLD
jgi:hypothetical protein